MKLDAIQEQEMINRFDRVVWRIVHRFMRFNNLGRTCTKDDLHQEGLIVLLEHIRTAENEATLKRLPVMDMWNAMSRLVISDQPIKFPSTRTTDFRKIMKKLGETVDYSELDSMNVCDNGIEEIETRLDMECFINSLHGLEKEIILLRLKGMSRSEVSEALHIPNAKTTRRLKKIYELYAAYSAA